MSATVLVLNPFPVTAQNPLMHFYAERLTDIIKRHIGAQDATHRAFLAWGIETLELFLAEKAIQPDLLRERVDLFFEKFRDCLTHGPLTTAWVAHGRLWEEWMLIHNRRLYPGSSPFSGEESLEKAQIFSLGNEIKELLQELAPSHEALLHRDEVEKLPDLHAKIGYGNLAKSCLEIEDAERETALAQAEALRCQESIEATRKSTQEHIEAMTQAMQAREELFQETVAHVRKNNALTVQHLQACNAQLESANEELIGRVIKTEAVSAHLKARLDGIMVELQSLRAQNDANRAAISQCDSGGCVIC